MHMQDKGTITQAVGRERYIASGGYRGGGGGGGGVGQTRPVPPLTTPPVHCNEFNYVISAALLQALDLLYVLSITPDTWLLCF